MAFSLCCWFPLLCRNLFYFVPLLFFCFCFLCFGFNIQEIIAKPMSYSFPPICPSSNFTVSGIVFNLFWIVLCVWCKIKIKFDSFSLPYPVVPNTIYGRDHLFPFCIPGNLVKDKLSIRVWVCVFWALSSVPLVYMTACHYHTILMTAAL